MALNGSSSTIMRASCSSTRANSMRCIWPPDSVPMVRFSKPLRPTAASACAILSRARLAHAAEKSGDAPEPGADEIEHRDRKAAVDIGGLRQIGDIPDIEIAGQIDARQRLEDADQPSKQRRFAGAVGADDRQQRARRDLAVEMMHRRMPVVAQRDVTELQLRAPCSPHRKPHHRPQAGADRERRTQAGPARSCAGSTRVRLAPDAAKPARGCGRGAWPWP